MAQVTVEDLCKHASGQRLSRPFPGDEVFITGISGSFPQSDSVAQLRDNLFNKVDMVSDNSRWKMNHPQIPNRGGKINHLNKFDAGFFGVHPKQANAMDPQMRIILEKTYEAIIDAGVNPQTLRNTKCGVFIGTSFSETEKTWMYDKPEADGLVLTGCSKSMLANRISYWLGVTGPSYVIDTACSSSLFAFEHAFRAIRDGLCDSAIVGGANLCLHPNITLLFSSLGVLSPDGKCKSYDNSANGYVRSEAIVACFLQRAKNSKRVYAQLLYAKTNCDGFKDQGITYPSGNMHKMLLKEFYEECSISPSLVEYVEGHATGTRVGDPEELMAFNDVFCLSRSDPLLIGTIKSNTGHCEPASGICGIAKLCIAYETGYIPPNLHYNTPRDGVEGLLNGRLKVVTEKTQWKRGLAAISSSGFGGTNAHVLLRNIAKEKVNKGLPSDSLPRLVCVSGRTESAVDKILDDLESRVVDVENVRLWHSIHEEDIRGHIFRGYTLLGSSPTSSVRLARNTDYYIGDRRPIWFVYSGMGSQWSGMGAELMRIPVFAAAIQRCHKALEPKGINLTQIVTDPDPKIYDNILSSFVGISAIQIALTDVLNSVGITPDCVIGHSFGELGCAYADGCFTAEQTILAAYSRGLVSIETSFIKGSMAVIGLGYNQAIAVCPPEIEIACHNGPESSTISGPADVMENLVTKLSAQNIFAKKVPVYDIAFHSRYITEAGPKLQKYLEQVIPDPKPRSERWFSTSVPRTEWHLPKAAYSSAEYHTNNFLNHVLFEETASWIHPNAITIEIAPHGLMQAILNHSLKKEVINICLTHKNYKDNVQVLFKALGKLYLAGLNPRLANIYPTVSFPVSRGTPMMAQLVEWEHSEDWYVTSNEPHRNGERTVSISITDEDIEFLSGHVIGGRNLYPASGYLFLVWETFSMMLGQHYTEVPVVFENVRFHRAVNIPSAEAVSLTIIIQKGSGTFEIMDNETSVVTGRIYTKKNIGQDYWAISTVSEVIDSGAKKLSTKDFYKELHLRGYQYRGQFCGVAECNLQGTHGVLCWADNWITFLDTMLQIKLLGSDTRELFVPTRIEKVSVDVSLHYQVISESNLSSIEVHSYPELGIIRSGGVEIRDIHVSSVSKKIPLVTPVLEKYEFVPNFGDIKMKVSDILRNIVQLVLENIKTYTFKCIEVIDDEYERNGLQPIMEVIGTILKDTPLVQPELLVFSETSLQMSSQITVLDKKIKEISETIIFVGANLLQRPECLLRGFSTLKDKCFVISREKDKPDPKLYLDKYDILNIHKTGLEYTVLIRKKIEIKPTKFIQISTTNLAFPWIEKVKEEMKETEKLVLYCQNEPVNGLLGLINCLRKENRGEIFHALLIADTKAPTFDPNLALYEEQLAKGLAINILQDGQWGTCRHILLQELKSVSTAHAYVKSLTVGDLSSLKWLEGGIRENQDFKNKDSILLHVYCAAINFRDVLIATGRVTADAGTEGRFAQDFVQGFEVVGKTANGDRMMAIIRNGGISNLAEAPNLLTWPIPDEWTFEEAATVPVAYATVYYAMITVGRLKRGESVLIHAGSGGVGQAAITVALHYGCEIFTTVGTDEKRALLKKLYPQLKDSHIGSSRNASFEHMIRLKTKGKGVNIVLNSLSDENLQASVRCLGYRGRFLELGKVDLINNTPLGMQCFLNDISFNGIGLQHIMYKDESLGKELHEQILMGIKTGVIRPLTYRTFEKEDVEEAFRYMAHGKHEGKVIIKIRNEDLSNLKAKPNYIRINALPRYMCNEDFVYIIVGGLGGFGLELANWLILRGARKVLLTSRRGISNGYQALRLRTWTSYKVNVQISTHDVTTKAGCEEMLLMANSMGYVEAIFNLAVILKDSLFENQTPESFMAAFGPKALACIHLDKLSRSLCPKLRDFVMFSSLASGRGNAGQTNYGFANSVMERICECRKRRGLPALAVQWGVIGDVGIVAEMQNNLKQIEIGGTLSQSINSCLQVLDQFLRQDAAVVSSYVVVEKEKSDTVCENAVDTVARLMGIKDLKYISSQVTLAELGMDSMLAVEINRTLEQNFDISLTNQDTRALTFARLSNLSNVHKKKSPTSSSLDNIAATIDITMLLNVVGDENKASEPLIYIPKMLTDDKEHKNCKDVAEDVIYMLPGIVGTAAGLEPLYKQLETNVCILQFGIDHVNENGEQMADRLFEVMKTRLLPGASFKLLGYSYGCSLIFYLADRLEKAGHKGVVFCIDGAPEYLQTYVSKMFTFQDDVQLENSFVSQVIKHLAPKKNINTADMTALNNIKSFKERVVTALKMAPVQTTYSDNFIASMVAVCYHRFKLLVNYDNKNIRRIKSPVILLRMKSNTPGLYEEDNYGLNKYTEGKLTVYNFECTHATIVDNKDCANIINKVLKEMKSQK